MGLEDVGYERDAANRRRVPVQANQRLGKPAGTVAWEIHYVAWRDYARHHYDQSAERLEERGGFCYGELQCALAGHYDRCGECREKHPPVPTWKPLK